MGHKKNKSKRPRDSSDGAVRSVTAQVHSAGPAPFPPKEQERRKRIFFRTHTKTHAPPTRAEVDEFRAIVSSQWFDDITAKVRATYVDTNRDGVPTPTVEIREILPVDFVRRVLAVGTKCLAASPNVLSLTVPGNDAADIREGLPQTHREALAKNASQKVDADQLSPSSTDGLGPVDLGVCPDRLDAGKIVMVGDTHGSFECIERILRAEGFPEPDKTVYLFNGDFVDRGSFSVEIYVVLLAIKIAHPDAVHLLRGNHETEAVNSNYSFILEINKKYAGLSEDERGELYKRFCESFKALPLCALVNDCYMVVHGGISGWPGFSVDDIHRLNRFREPESSDFMNFHFFDPLNDLLWADSTSECDDLAFNFMRGTSVTFGPAAARRFLKAAKLRYIMRSHTCVPEGWLAEHGNMTHTVFSVPNYAEDNLGAYAVFYGVYDKGEELTDAERRLYGDDATALTRYTRTTPEPLVFIKKFTCSLNASITNQPLCEEMMHSFFLEADEEVNEGLVDKLLQDPSFKEQILRQVVADPDSCDVCTPDVEEVASPVLIDSLVVAAKNSGGEVLAGDTGDAALCKRLVRHGSTIAVPLSGPRDKLSQREIDDHNQSVLTLLTLVAGILDLSQAAVFGCLPHSLRPYVIGVPLSNSMMLTLDEMSISVPDVAFPPILPESVVRFVIQALARGPGGDEWLQSDCAAQIKKCFREFASESAKGEPGRSGREPHRCCYSNSRLCKMKW